MGKKSQPTQPAAPDPMKTAQAQTQQNKDAAVAQANLNRIDQYTPQGNSTYSQVGTNADGTPKYAQTTTYSADEQKKYDQANQVAIALNGLASNNIDRVAQTQSKDFNFDGMTPQVTSIGGGLPGLQYGSAGDPVQKSLDYSNLTKLPGTSDFGAEGQRMADSVYNQYTSRLDPKFQQSQSDMEAKLAAQGISNNSDAYRREVDNAGRTKNDAYGQAAYQAQQAGAQEQSRLFGLALGARQQGQNEVNTQGAFANDANAQQFGQNQSAAGFNNATQGQAFNQQGANATLANQGRQQQITEASYLRNLPLNEIAALMGTAGGVNDPTFQQVSQVGVAAPDYQGLVQNNYTSAMNQYNRQQQARSQALGSMASTAGTLATMFMSDRRLKRDIREIGKLANGLKTYAFKYIGDNVQRFGVMAQDVLKVRPDAVFNTPSGYLAVDYGRVL